jgi:hypothetical protein
MRGPPIERSKLLVFNRCSAQRVHYPACGTVLPVHARNPRRSVPPVRLLVVVIIIIAISGRDALAPKRMIIARADDVPCLSVV